MSGSSQRILIIGPSWVGDMIMAQSLFKKLKQASSAPEISVLAPQWTHPVLERMPEVSDAVIMPVGHGALDLGSRLRLGQELKGREFDQAIILPGSLKSALTPLFAKIPRRTGYKGEMRYGLVNDVHQLDKTALPTTVQRFVNLAGNAPRLEDCPRPQLAHDRARALNVAAGFGYEDKAPLLVLCPGAEYGPAKRWPIQRFAELASLRSAQGWQVWLMGSGKDKEACRCINTLAKNSCTDLSGKTSLTEAIDLMSLANAVVTNDSGLMHLAAALQRPLVSIYGSSSPVMTPPLSENAQIEWLQLDCAPCFKRDCPLGHMKCLNDISARRVDQAIERLDSAS